MFFIFSSFFETRLPKVSLRVNAISYILMIIYGVRKAYLNFLYFKFCSNNNRYRFYSNFLLCNIHFPILSETGFKCK